MWCIAEITQEYRKRMYRLMDLYKKPYNPKLPVVCFDEKSKQLLEDSRTPIKMKPGSVKKYDYEYRRNGLISDTFYLAGSGTGPDPLFLNDDCAVRQTTSHEKICFGFSMDFVSFG